MNAMILTWPIGRGSWDPRTSPEAVRRAAEASKQERARQAAARHVEIQRSIGETQRLSRTPVGSAGRSLRVANIYRDRARGAQADAGDRQHTSTSSTNRTSVTPHSVRSFGELARNYYTRDVGASERTELISAQSRGGSR